jgi:hypothetical protein
MKAVTLVKGAKKTSQGYCPVYSNEWSLWLGHVWLNVKAMSNTYENSLVDKSVTKRLWWAHEGLLPESRFGG